MKNNGQTVALNVDEAYILYLDLPILPTVETTFSFPS